MRHNQAVFVAVVFVCGLFVGVLVGYSFPSGRIISLESQNSDLLQSNASKDAQIASLESQNADLSSRVNATLLEVHFSPNGGCKDQIIGWIDRANSTVHVLIYSFTEDDIGDAIKRAHERGIDVKIVFDYEQISQYSEYEPLLAVGVDVRVDTGSGSMHDKVAVIDGVYVLTGSYNWSNAAEHSNNENLVIIKGQYLASQFEQEFQDIWSLAQ